MLAMLLKPAYLSAFQINVFQSPRPAPPHTTQTYREHERTQTATTKTTRNLNIKSKKTRFSLDFVKTLSLMLYDARGQKSVFSFYLGLMKQAGILFYAVLNSCFSSQSRNINESKNETE